MAKFITFYDPCCGFGGHNYFATTDGKIVHIKHKAPSSTTYKIVQRLTKTSWDKFADDHDLTDRNLHNPALISALASASAGGDDPFYSEYIAA